MNLQHKRDRLRIVILLLLLLVSALVYWPALHGGFILDDWANLHSLDTINDGTAIDDLLLFVVSGHSGPLGRPFSLLTFALQYDAWPNNPFVFKLVNLAIHLLNGALVFLVVRRVLDICKDTASKAAIPLSLIVAGLWLLHPIHMSSVAYTVQRMNLLAGLFMLLGILAYLEARRWRETNTKTAMLLAWVGLPIAAIFGVLSKENAGGLLFLLVWLEFGWTPTQQPAWWKWWRTVVLLLPLTVVVVAFTLMHDTLIGSNYGTKPFELHERLLSQPRALLTYLKVLILPAAQDVGLIHDDFTLSTGLTTPLTTLPALVGVTGLAAAAFLFRRRWPVEALGLGWFFTTHLIESTVFPLELYFEHRNYIPSIGILIALAGIGFKAWHHLASRLIKSLAVGGIVAYGVFFAFLTINEAALWANPIQQAFVWASENPDSRRAQFWKATVMSSMGRHSESIDLLAQISERFDSPALAKMTQLEMSCDVEAISPPALSDTVQALRKEPAGIGPTNVIDNVLLKKGRGRCEGVTPEYLEALVRALLANPEYDRNLPLLQSQLGRSLMLQGELETAIDHMVTAADLSTNIDYAMQAALWLAYAGRAEESRHYLQLAQDRMAERGGLLNRAAYADRIQYVEQVLRDRNGSHDEQD